MKLYLLLITLVFNIHFLLAQDNQPPYSSGIDRINTKSQKEKLANESLVSNIPFRSVGPTVFSGRVTDLAVSPTDPSHFYVAYASGGLWKTENNGTSFFPLFENESVMTIGDIAVDWQENTIWIGTGENNSSRSSYAGIGMYKSEDGGKTWTHKGLEESHHIGRIILHPTNPNILWVAALGHLYSPNEERGVFKTMDGGDTWTKVLYVNENAGAIDLVIDPTNPNQLYAATWHRERRAWNFVESGVGTGIHKSTDGGETWTLVTNKESGFPTGEGAGRIGLTIGVDEGKTVLFASLDNYFRRPKEDKKKKDGLNKDDLREMSKERFLKLKDKEISDFLSNNGFPEKYNLKAVKEIVKSNKIKPIALVEYLEDANSLLFDTPVIGAEIYRSNDNGMTWKKTHEGYLDDLFYSYGYYFGQVRVSPRDINKIYIVGVPILRSDDGGKTFKSINGDNVHVDHHALWVDPDRDGHLILGNDGGVNISYDDGESWRKCNSLPLGQFYAINVDMEKPYNIYGGLQDNGVWVGPSTYKKSTSWHEEGQYPYKRIMGGDGMQIAVDTRDNETIYTGYQFGNYFRLNRKTGNQKYLTPKHELGERPLRWNWQTPIHLSIHNQDILYMGSNKVHRSFNQGDDFEAISDDLTKGGKQGDVAYGTLTSIHESPLKFGLLYAGSDDGLIHVSKDGGNTWTKISESIVPQDMWVSRVQASQHEKSRVYASLNGYRWDDFNPYLYVSEDYGSTWNAIGTDLPLEPINVIKEDPKNENLLYVGTDNGLYVSLNRGESFMLMNKDLPAVSVHDVIIHPRENDLIVGTHGRSIYVANVAHLQSMNAEILASELALFSVNKKTYQSGWGSTWSKWLEARTPSCPIRFYTKSGGDYQIKIKTEKGLTLANIKANATRGINTYDYDLSVEESAAIPYELYLNKVKKEDDKTIRLKKAKNEKYYLQPGKYKVELTKSGQTKEVDLLIE